MERKLGLQLYSLRQFSEKDFVSVLNFAAEVGFKTVEPAGFFDLSPVELKKILNDLGLEMPTSHTPWVRPENISESIDLACELGLKYVVCGFGPDDFKDLDAIRRCADFVNSALEKTASAGLTLFQHNHYWEFERLNGELKYDIYAKMVPGVKFQLDAFWSSNFGANDPAEMVARYADRIVSLHIKDGTFEQDPAKVEIVNGYPDRKLKLFPLGEGQMDIPSIIAAAPANVDNVIVELDYCEVEMKEALRRSYAYMTSNGFAAGNR